jgi:hypothetical protein
MPRTERLDIRVSEGDLKAIDSLRGGWWSRSEYVRQALADAIKSGKRGPEVADR